MRRSPVLFVLFAALFVTEGVASAATISDGAAKVQATELTTTIADSNGEKQCVAQGGKVLSASNGQKTCSINYNASKSNTVSN